MDFKSCINQLLQDYFYGDGQLKMIDSENNHIVYLTSQSCADCSENLYLICNILENMESKYTYPMYIGNHDLYFNPLENDEDCFMKQVDEFFERNYIFDTTKWSIYK